MTYEQPTLGRSSPDGRVHCLTASRNVSGGHSVVSQLEVQPPRDSHLRPSGLRVIPFFRVGLPGDRNRAKATSPARLPSTVASAFRAHTLHYVLALQASGKQGATWERRTGHRTGAALSHRLAKACRSRPTHGEDVKPADSLLRSESNPGAQAPRLKPSHTRETPEPRTRQSYRSGGV